MGSLTIRNLDDSLIRGLEDRAQRSGRSVEEEAAAVLAGAVMPVSVNRTELFARMDALRALTVGTAQVPSEVLLREVRDER